MTAAEASDVANIKCFTNDDVTAAALTGDANCVAVPITLGNGLVQFRAKS